MPKRDESQREGGVVELEDVAELRRAPKVRLGSALGKVTGELGDAARVLDRGDIVRRGDLGEFGDGGRVRLRGTVA